MGDFKAVILLSLLFLFFHVACEICTALSHSPFAFASLGSSSRLILHHPAWPGHGNGRANFGNRAFLSKDACALQP